MPVPVVSGGVDFLNSSLVCFTVSGRSVAGSCEGLSRSAAVPGDAELGAVLRDLRRSRCLSLASVARRAGCAESQLSYVESGSRTLHPWLAKELDAIYRSGGVITVLLRARDRAHKTIVDQALHKDMLMVALPEGGASMPLSRRELLAVLGVGIAGGPLFDKFEAALDAVRFGDDALTSFEEAYEGFQAAARVLHPATVMDGLIGNVAILDGFRRRSTGPARQAFSRMQARYAESLSWLSEEAADLAGSMYWIDRAGQWGEAAGWSAMSAYGFVRRSMMVISFSGDGNRAVDNASVVLSMRSASPRMKGLAAKQIAFGHALVGDEAASKCALNEAMSLLSKPPREDDSILGQRSVVDDDLFAIFQATCDIYLGRGQRAVATLEPRLGSLTASSSRTATITRAKLARAYANVGQPKEAARVALEALGDVERIGSLSARSELHRALPALHRWRGRADVRGVIDRLVT